METKKKVMTKTELELLRRAAARFDYILLVTPENNLDLLKRRNQTGNDAEARWANFERTFGFDQGEEIRQFFENLATAELQKWKNAFSWLYPTIKAFGWELDYAIDAIYLVGINSRRKLRCFAYDYDSVSILSEYVSEAYSLYLERLGTEELRAIKPQGDWKDGEMRLRKD